MIILKIIDLHCDVLYKLWQGEGKLSFQSSLELDTNFERLKQGKVKVQCFAIFMDPEVSVEEKFQVACTQIDYFYKEVFGKHPEMKQIKKWSDFHTLKPGEIGAMLTLEGVDAIGNDLEKLHKLYALGVRSVGLTWNNANLAADGIGELRGAGLTEFGQEIVQFNNQHQLLTDVSHLSERGFWEVIELAKYPIASHSNARAICSHRRNLTDAQAQALFQKEAMVHTVFYPEFIKDKGSVNIADLIKHIDHFCMLGGEKYIGFGSDFDGIGFHVEGLEHAGKYQDLIGQLLNYYSADQVKGFASQNFLDCYCKTY